MDEIFDLIIGCSTGGIIGFGLIGRQMAAKKLLKMYEELGKNIFNRLSFFELAQHFALYDIDNLDRVLSCSFKDMTLRDMQNDKSIPKVCSVSNFYNQNVQMYYPFLFRTYESPYEKNDSVFYMSRENLQEYCEDIQMDKSNYNHVMNNDIRIVDVLKASCAAPAYFESFCIDEEKKLNFIDGGILYNNPSMIGYFEMKKIFPNSLITMMSLGTGDPNLIRKIEDNSRWREVLTLGTASVIDNASQQAIAYYNTVSEAKTSHYKMKMLSEMDVSIDYLRLSPSIEREIDLATIKDEDYKYFRDVVNEYLSTKETIEKLLWFLRKLKVKMLYNKEMSFWKQIEKSIFTLQNFINEYEDIEKSMMNEQYKSEISYRISRKVIKFFNCETN